MANRRKGIPKYCRQRGSDADRAYVELSARRYYLGEYGSPESHRVYGRVLAEWKAGGEQPPATPDLTIIEVLARFWQYAETTYQNQGTLENFKYALRPLKALYGDVLVDDFGRRELKAVRQSVVDRGVSRRYVNQSTQRLVQIFRWGADEGLVSPDVLSSLEAVQPLRRGRCAARETKPVRPAPDADVAAIRPFVSRQIWAVVQMQLYTGARPGEVLAIKGSDIDTSGRIWEYRPGEHKTAHRGHERVLFLDPKAQAVLGPFLTTRRPDEFLFSPREAERERRLRQHSERRTPFSCGNVPGSNRVAVRQREVGECYTTDSYRHAITRACKQAGVPHWHPHQLRHNAATRLRKEFGLDVARVILGHRSPQVTDMYAELDRERAIEAMGRIG